MNDRDADILAFEARAWHHSGAKEQAIKETFGLTATRYYQILAELTDDPEAMAAQPALVRRLRARIEARGARRGGESGPADPPSPAR